MSGRRQGRLGESDRAFDLVRGLPLPIREADVARVTGWAIARARAWLYRHVHADALAWSSPGEAVRTQWFPGGGGAEAVGVKNARRAKPAHRAQNDLESAERLLDRATANGNAPLAEIMEFRVRKLRRETSA